MHDSDPSPVLYAFDVCEGSPSRKLPPANLKEAPADDVAYRWIHLDFTQPGAKEIVQSQVDDIVAEVLTADDARPRCVKHKNGLLLTLRGVNLNPNSDPEDMVSIRMWIEDNKIISVRRRRLMAIVSLREEIEGGMPPKSIGSFLAKLVHGLTEHMDSVISDLSDKVDELEVTSIEAPEGLRTDLAGLRRTIIMLRRYIAPQREALARLYADSAGMFGDGDRTSLRETLDQITRMVEEMDAVRERCSILYEQIADRRAEEMNRNMMVLSVVAAIFLPLGFITGLLGVNVGGIPGAQNAYAFPALCFLMLVIAVVIALVFRKLKWI